ncbi:hypothetical protein RND81_03G032900 [Saponaria officinalis]|uniref:SWIM-type domain-containing protein n=1 Tax=Saponaria officinalis TaxID=3572 RepID=A0AAW1M520_SAPOF
MTLCRVFWADAEAIRNYSCFGDAISFDPTYGTNKYCMVFTPFTGVDHHKRSDFFGASLLSNEDEESFKWTFENFLKAMSQKEPQCIITDQDPAIKNAVRSVFKKSRHRFCMWHIMGKVTDKVGSSIFRDTDFLSRLNSIVWDSDLEPFEFEEKWTELMNDFEMADHSCFSAMFAIRKNWILAYHRVLPMGCILRTTQSAHSLPVTVTPLHLEAHAANVEITDVDDAGTGTGKTFKVFYNISTTAATCTCKLFERKGLLCRHILWVYSGKGVRSIPKRYILSRWTKDALNSDKNVVDDHDFVNSNQTNLSKVWSEFHETVSLLKTVPDVHVEELSRLLVEFRDKICPQAEPLTNDQEMEMLLGCSASSAITILPPTKSNNKGSGKRLRSTKA